MTIQFDTPMLDGALVRLVPLSRSHADDLMVAAEEDRRQYGLRVRLVQK